MKNKKIPQRTDSEEFIPMNTELSDFFVEELEQRLETDPLIIGGLLDLFSTHNDQVGTVYMGCDINNCDGQQCGQN